MEKLSHSLHRNQASAALSKKICNGNGFMAKTVYDDVFGGPPKFGVPTFSPRDEDYSEIFGSFHLSRASSIPVLDLPVVDEAEVSFDVRSSKFDYSEVFGGFNCLDFAVSFEDLLEQYNGGDDSSDEAWTPAESESLSEESDPSAYIARNQFISNSDSQQSSDDIKQFNMSYHQTHHISQDTMNGLTHVSHLQAVPGFTLVVDETTPLQKIEDKNPSLEVSDDIKLTMDVNRREMEGKHFRKTKSLPPNGIAGIQRSTSASKHQSGYDNYNFHHDAMFLTISDVSLKTRPSQLPPPSRQPPAFEFKNEDKISVLATHEATRNYAFEEIQEGSSPLFFDVQVDASSSAAASAAAMKEAMENAQAKLKSAKELMERKKEVLQSCSKQRLKNDVKDKGQVTTVVDGSISLSDERVHGTCERENNGMGIFIGKEKLNAMKTAQSAPDSIETEKILKVAKISAEKKHGKESLSSQESFKSEGIGEWKEAVEFYELVSTDIPTKAFDQAQNQNISEKNMKVYERKELKTTMEGFELQEHNDKRVSREAVEREEYKGTFRIGKETCEGIENKRRLKSSNKACPPVEHKKNIKVPEEVFKRKENEKKLHVTLEHEECEQKPIKVDEREVYKLTVVQEKTKEVEAEYAVKHWENEQKPTEFNDRIECENKLKEACERAVIENRLNETLKQEKNGERLDKAFEHTECEKVLKETTELKGNEKRSKEVLEQAEDERKQQVVHERKEREKNTKGVLEGEESEKQKMALQREENEKSLKKGVEWEENETLVLEENEKEQRQVYEKEAKEKRLIETLEQEENEKSLKGVVNKEENDKKQKEAQKREKNEKLKKEEVCKKKNTEKRLKEACKREVIEKRPKESCVQVENEARSRQVLDKVENEKKFSEASEQEELDKKSKQAKKWEETVKSFEDEPEEMNAPHNAHEQTDDDENEKKVIVVHETFVHMEGGNLKTSDGASAEENIDLQSAQEVCEHERNSGKLEPTLTAIAPGENGKKMIETNDSGKELDTVEISDVLVDEALKASCVVQVDLDHQFRSKDAMEFLPSVNVRKSSLEAGYGVGPLDNEKNERASLMCDSDNTEKKLTHDWEGKGTNINMTQYTSDQEKKKDKFMSTQVVKVQVDVERRMEIAQSAVKQGKGNTQKIAQQVNTNENTERKWKNETLRTEEKDKEERMRREKELEKERLRKMEEEWEREREREKDRMAVETATFEARERAYTEARGRAERAAVERATAEARQRALAEARERLEKACAEAREKSLAEKASIEVRLRAERAAVERATAEAWERATGKAMAEKASSRDGGMRQSSSTSERQSMGYSSSLRPAYSSVFAGVEGESAQRCKARLERHRRTAERAAKALADKNMRDLLAQREQAERSRLSEALDAEVKRWSGGKEGNLRALLSTLQYILGPHSGWQPIPLTDVITAVGVKRAYRKATLCVHPDKLQQRGASIQQKYICEKVFDLLKEAWNKFNSEER